MVKSGQYSKTGESAKISHVAKIMEFSISLCIDLQFLSALSMHCLCSFELGSGSSHLNWLEESGTIGLQNYKNIHKI